MRRRDARFDRGPVSVNGDGDGDGVWRGVK